MYITLSGDILEIKQHGNYQFAISRELALKEGIKVIGPNHNFLLKYIQNTVKGNRRRTLPYNMHTANGLEKRVADIYPLLDGYCCKQEAVALVHNYRIERGG